MNGYVYLIAADEAPLSKIGWALNLDRRLSALQIGSPLVLKVIGYWDGDGKMEQWLHRNFTRRHAHGEWFKFTGADRGYGYVEAAIRRYRDGDKRHDWEIPPPRIRRRVAS